jgi:hypothetical protein
MILTGMARIPGRRMPRETVEQHLDILFKTMEQVADQVTFGAVFVGPAAVLWGYQNLLKLAGKDPASAFPEGLWQFYVEYALREDTARHVNETHGFDTLLQQHEIRLGEVDRITAWVMAIISELNQYDALLEVEWRERVATSLLQKVTQKLPNAAHYASLYRRWEAQRPYRRGAEAANYDYPAYRRLKFEHFLREATRDLPALLRGDWQTQLQRASEQDLPAYQQQMSILAFLEPGEYGETRQPFEFHQAQVGLILNNNYYLLPVCTPGTDQPQDALTVRAQIASLLRSPSHRPTNLIPLAQMKRAHWQTLRPKLNPSLQSDLEQLRYAPIFFNCNPRPARQTLTQIRQAERGIGSHALTIFSAGRTYIFDQSHIFFDGVLGAAMAEILTNEALSWAVYLHSLPSPQPAREAIYTGLDFPQTPSDHQALRTAPRVTPEVGAENSQANLQECLALRQIFKRRSATLQLTVNDLLALYRAIHAQTYQPSARLQAEWKPLAAPLVEKITRSLQETRRANPALLIPIDASRNNPRERLYPLSLEVPLTELNLLALHRRTTQALLAYEQAEGDRAKPYADFDRAQREYLATLAGLGEIFNKLKEIAARGESASAGAIKLLAHLPPALQRLLDQVPARVDMLNNMIKGREVFSNVGAVVPTSTLTRFVTAKDDNEQKQLAWGILTDAQNILHISLRDFRPHVAALQAANRADLAQSIAQEYLDSYVSGFNQFIQELRRITAASRETQLLRR